MKQFNTKIQIVVIISTLTFSLMSCSLNRFGIYKAYSFYKINTPGTIPVDDNGNVIGKIHDTTFAIYLEMKKDVQPKLLGASFHGNFYQLNLFQEKENVIIVGNSLPDNKPVTVTAEKNHQLWKAELGKIIKTSTEQGIDNTILSIEVEHKGKKGFRLIKKHTELVPELHY